MDDVNMAAPYPTAEALATKGKQLMDAWIADPVLKQQRWVRKLVDLYDDAVESGLAPAIFYSCVGLCYYIDSYSLLSYNDVTKKDRVATQTYLGRVNILKNQHIALYTSTVYKKIENILHPKPRATTRDSLFSDKGLYVSHLSVQP